ncbi:hypothetical protein LZ318_30925 [Saccharopolyspora indica]|uniref:hypothetical protein n=1 Tax=Saccharopolyspora indica TaxID=1229659 RepID=UPI0022EB03D6|nr:hypothetical protein [Saccharopolyspora indica]MDA3644353.1 hypothetical protein [Saccharopolyspora indica]
MEAAVSRPAPLFELQHTGATPVCWSYGMGAESTAGVVRTLLDPGFRPPELLEDLSNLIVMTAQTGDEWSSTADLVERHVLPLLRQYRVRMVEVARAGPAQRDGIVVLQDTRTPQRMHADPVEHGFFALSDEHRGNGVLPQLGGSRKCSSKAKGGPLDVWRAREVGSRPYVHAVGFSATEGNRIVGDAAVTLGGQRRAIYPIHAAGLSREDCRDYLHELFGVWWPKSCCRQCPFSGGKTGWPEQLARFQALPAEAAPHLADEYVTVALNKRSGLFGPGGTLREKLELGQATAVLALAEEAIAAADWALYRVRRCYSAPAAAWRAVEVVHRGDRLSATLLLAELADRLGRRPGLRHEGGHTRLWLAERHGDRYPQVEEFYVAAPAQVHDKAREGFDTRWRTCVGEDLLDLEDETAAALIDLTGTSAPTSAESSLFAATNTGPQ